MDLVTCEAPLDNSFQKDRRELVNKGSLGRRRKPSRSNLKLILSPTTDPHDTVVFSSCRRTDTTRDIFKNETSSNHLNGRYVSKQQENATRENCQAEFFGINHPQSVKCSNSFRHHSDISDYTEPIDSSYNHLPGIERSNQQEPTTIDRFNTNESNGCQLKSVESKNSQLNVVSSNYQAVIASINKLRKINGEDHNCHSNKPLSATDIYQIPFPVDNHSVIQGKDAQGCRIEVNKENSDHGPQLTVSRNLQKINCSNNKKDATNCRHSIYTSNSYDNAGVVKDQARDFKIETLNFHNRQKADDSRNYRNIITFSNHRQIVTSTPVQNKKQVIKNTKQNGVTSQHGYSNSKAEASLPRTSTTPNLVAEAQQFSIEAKLKRKKSEVQGRSAVLIQTWERRTLSDSFSKRKDSKITSLRNRFGEKENNNTDAMPDSYICTKYKGSLQNGDIPEKDKMVRDVIPDEIMLYRGAESTHEKIQPRLTTTKLVEDGNSSVPQEPEWISLSKMLCAKFVEGHIEPHSPDSYLQEEPEGVGEKIVRSPQIQAHSDKTYLAYGDIQKRKAAVSAPEEDETLNSNGPPWIHLSRKLCNKFIEEHIEYPPITNGHFVEVPEFVEPNGDVRIIEKVGKPKSRKSKQKKEGEPEWISLSKKLRTKFRESHIDDPDTIALDNQLNVSDPEETGSESLSDLSQEMAVPKKKSNGIVERNFKEKWEEKEVQDTFGIQHEKETVVNAQIASEFQNINSVIFPEKECCWEYQEMEFDQESNSGNFHEVESYDEPLQEARVHRGCLPEDELGISTEKKTIPFDENKQFQALECYNNDVKFVSKLSSDDILETNQQLNKRFTVQIIAHDDSNSNQNDIQADNRGSPCKGEAIHGSFFNLSTWKEAHCTDGRTKGPITSTKEPLSKDLRSKSLDNLYDSLEDRLKASEDIRQIKNSVNCINSIQEPKTNVEKPVNNVSMGVFFEEFEIDPHSLNKGLCASENSVIVSDKSRDESELGKENSSKSSCFERKQNIPFKSHDAESSSDDEEFNAMSKNRKFSENSKHYVKVSPNKSYEVRKDQSETQQKIEQKTIINESLRPKESETSKKSEKNFKCNGMIPNSIYSGLPENKVSSSKQNQNEKLSHECHKDPPKLGMSKWITISKPDQNINKNEYSNLRPNYNKNQKVAMQSSEKIFEPKEVKSGKTFSDKEYVNDKSHAISNDSASQKYTDQRKGIHSSSSIFDESEKSNSNLFNEPVKEFDLKHKCKSMCDIFYNKDCSQDGDSFRQHESMANLSSVSPTENNSQIEFQHFEFESEIPLCAKLVSKQNRKKSSKNPVFTSPSNRAESPCYSETSHVYEDMFKETPSGPSDSEASSWTAMKNNSYYVSGRSSSMNDLDYSDSCSMSVKCDYASSSENSTLQSRHSSCASSSFYVNLRDYDSHMLERSLKNQPKQSNGKNRGNPSSVSKSNPPTPESLRHLFTSPLSSIHSSSNGASRLLNRMSSDPQSHYYSTAAAATSSAFKHGFALAPPKPKKPERSSSIKIKDIAHGIILTFKKFQNHSKNSNVSPTQYVDVSHLAEINSNEGGKAKRNQKVSKKQNLDKEGWKENGKTDTDSGFLSDAQRTKARRSSSDLTDLKSKSDACNQEKKKCKGSKKNSNREKGKKSRSKVSEPRTIPTVSRKVQQMADGTLYLVTTVSGDTSMPGVYSDSPDTSSELSTHRPIRLNGESNC